METTSKTRKRSKTSRRATRTKKKKKSIKLDIPILDKVMTKGGSSDFLLVLFTAMLAIFGLIMIFSASYYYSLSRYGNPYYYLIRHGIWLL